MTATYAKLGDLFVHRDYHQRLKDRGLDNFDALMRVEGEKTLDKKNLADWRKRIVLTVGEETLFLKRYDKPPLKEQFRQRCQGYAATASAEWHWLRTFAELGISCPVAVAFGRRGSGPIESQSLIVTATVRGSSLEQQVKDTAFIARLSDGHFKHALLKTVAAFVNSMHSRGLFHRDLYLAHLFAALDEQQTEAADNAVDAHAPIDLAVIDLQRVIKPCFAHRWRVKDLAALHYSTPQQCASKTDRLRWFKWYRNTDRLTAADRRLIRAIVQKADRVARHSKKHGYG